MPAEWQTPSRLSDIARPQKGFENQMALSDGARRLTYVELDHEVRRAQAAYAALGLLPGDRVVLLLPTSIEFVVAWLSAQRASLVVIPLNPLLGPEEIAFIFSTMRPALVIAASASTNFPLLAELDALVAATNPPTRLIRYGGEADAFDQAIARAPCDLPATPRAPNDEALILFTSGTSGCPKGASHRERAIVTNVRHSNMVLRIAADDVLLCPLPLSHVFGQIVLMLGALMAGAELSLLARPSPECTFDALVTRRPTLLAAVPAIFAALADQGRRSPDAAAAISGHLHFALSGGAPLSAATGEAFERVFGIPVHQGYGMTEVACCIAIEEPGQSPSGGVGPICTPLAHRIIADGDNPHEGELEIAGPNMMAGYYIDGELSPRADDEWFPTGDIVRQDAQGNITVFDRKKEMIIRNGYNVYPSEVEAALTSHPDVLLAAVIGVDDPAIGQEIGAFVTIRAGSTLSPAMLADWCRSRIALYKYPRLIATLDTMPTNATGKIRKRALDHDLLTRVDLR